MRQSDRHPLPSEQEFEQLANRYIVVPGVLWVVAILVAAAFTLTSPAAAPTETAAPAEQAPIAVVGA